MAMTITVALDETRAAAVVTVDGIDPGAATYTVQRASPSGNTAGVRGHVNAVVPGPTVIAHDYEAPLNLELTYTATAYDAAGALLETAVAAPFTIDWVACESWLVDLARPTNSLTLVIQSMTELAFDFAVGVHRVLNRRAPVLTTLPAWTPGAELIVLTDTLDERDQVRALLGNGYPILLRTSPDLGIGNLYLGVTAFIEERFLTLGVRPERRFRVQTVQVQRPDPGYFVPVPPNTYQNVTATYATYADLEAAVGTYDELAYTYPPDLVASPIEPWLPDDI
jgi:hypothetical protein